MSLPLFGHPGEVFRTVEISLISETEFYLQDLQTDSQIFGVL